MVSPVRVDLSQEDEALLCRLVSQGRSTRACAEALAHTGLSHSTIARRIAELREAGKLAKLPAEAVSPPPSARATPPKPPPPPATDRDREVDKLLAASPVLTRIKSALAGALGRHPEAAADAVRALREVEL